MPASYAFNPIQKNYDWAHKTCGTIEYKSNNNVTKQPDDADQLAIHHSHNVLPTTLLSRMHAFGILIFQLAHMVRSIIISFEVHN